LVHFLLDDNGANQVLLQLLRLSISLVYQFLHSIITAQLLHFFRPNFFLLPREGRKKTQQMLPVLFLLLFCGLLAVLLVVNGKRFHVAAFSIVLHYSSNIITKVPTLPFPNYSIWSQN
jgi:hypothetical protein